MKNKIVLVGDSSGRAHVVLWEKDVKCFTVGNSYKLFSVTVRLFGGVNYLSVGQQSRIVPIDDIGIVAPL